MLAKTLLKIDHAFDVETLEEIFHMRELSLDHYLNLSRDINQALEKVGEGNVFELKKEIDEKISELKKRIADKDEAVYFDEIQLYIDAQT